MKHEEKYAGYIESLKQDVDMVIVADKWVLWDNHDELDTNIALAAQHGKSIVTSKGCYIYKHQEI